MFDRLKTTLVESYVGAIAAGWLLAQSIVHFAYIFSAPITSWIMSDEYRRYAEHASSTVSFSLKEGLVELVRSLSLFLVWYVLQRWLYFKPAKVEASHQTAVPGPLA